jgi:hypothetical protein
LREINERSAHLPHDGGDREDYESGMSGTRTLAEVVRALSVLALLFLNFAHQPAFAAQSGEDVLSAIIGQSFCGAPVADDDGHAPCHACRIGGGADLPPAVELPCSSPSVAIRLAGALEPFVLARFAPGPTSARGPPAA